MSTFLRDILSKGRIWESVSQREVGDHSQITILYLRLNSRSSFNFGLLSPGGEAGSEGGGFGEAAGEARGDGCPSQRVGGAGAVCLDFFCRFLVEVIFILCLYHVNIHSLHLLYLCSTDGRAAPAGKRD